MLLIKLKINAALSYQIFPDIAALAMSYLVRKKINQIVGLQFHIKSIK
jgi:hypothetical protein